MDDDPASIFGTSIEDHFALNNFDGGTMFEPQSPSIDPRVVSNHGGLDQTHRHGGTNRTPSWSTTPAAQHGRQVAPKSSPRNTQQQSRSVPMKSASGIGKDALGLGQEMRSAAQRMRSLGTQLLELERYTFLPSEPGITTI
jgi:hypothetical protein